MVSDQQCSGMSLWRFAGAELDEANRKLSVDGNLVAIEAKAMDVLRLLLERAGTLVSTEEFLRVVWGGRIVNESALSNQIGKVRKALGDSDQSIIETVPARGYRLVCPVQRAAPAPPVLSAAQLQVGQTVPGRDRWLLVERLIPGGFGEVWLAQHKQTHEKRVFKFAFEPGHLEALKREVTLSRVLRSTLGDREDFVRLLECNFDHSPYFLETDYAGLNLRQWTETKGGVREIPLEERIEIVARVADAVAAAHSVGILHKDIKPENILCLDGADGLQVRLGDFGAGRLLNDSQLEQLDITRLGFNQTVEGASASGTVSCMAPELIAGSNATVVSDVFALGFLLYQMAAGAFGRPLVPGWEADVDDEILREDIAVATNSNPLKRLSSAQLLADRLRTLGRRRDELAQRRLEQERFARAQYTIERARQRRPWVLAVLVSLVVGLAATGYYYLQARHESQEAQRQSKEAEALNDFLIDDILMPSSPVAGGAGTDTLKDALVRALPSAQSRFAHDPIEEAHIDSLIASTLSYYDQEAAALSAYQRVEQIYEKEYGAHSSRAVEARVIVASVLIDMGHAKEGKQALEASLPELRTMQKVPDEALIEGLAADAKLAGYEGGREQSVAKFRDLIGVVHSAIDQHQVPDVDLLTQEQESLMLAMNDAGKFSETEALGKSLLPSIQNTYGKDGNLTALMKVLIAGALAGQQRYADAEQDLTSLCRELESQAGKSDPNTSLCRSYLAHVYLATDRWSLAEPLLREVYSNYLLQYGAESQDTIAVGTQLASSLDHLGRYADADSLSAEVSKNATNFVSARSEDYGNALWARAEVLLHLRRLADAAKVIDDFAHFCDEAFPQDDMWKFRKRLLLAEQNDAAGNHERAVVDATELLDGIRRAPHTWDQHVALSAATHLISN